MSTEDIGVNIGKGFLPIGVQQLDFLNESTLKPYESIRSAGRKRKRELKRQAALIIERAREQVRLSARAGQRFRSTQDAAYGAAGVRLSSATVSAVKEQTNLDLRTQQNAVMRDAWQQAIALMNEGRNVNNQARAQGQQFLTKRAFDAASFLVTMGMSPGLGAATAASSQASPQQSSPGQPVYL